MDRYLHLGGVVAVGFDPAGEYLLVITHSGRGVYSTRSWERVARNTELAYPERGIGVGIGPIDGQCIRITEMDYESGYMRAVSPDGWSWDGNDEMDAAQGRGWAVLKGDELHGMIFFHDGDDSEFVAKKKPKR